LTGRQPMPRAQKVLTAGEPRGEIIDTLLLKCADRRKQQGFAFGGKGTCIEFDFPQTPRLRTDDLLVLDDGNLVEVVADAEPLLELRTADFAAVARIIWTLGNRHVPVEILPNRIRMLQTAETEALLVQRGLAATQVMAPFEPQDGDESPHGHGHHDHGHHADQDHTHHRHADHDHHDHGDHHHRDDKHDHGHGVGQRHDHSHDHDHGHENDRAPPHGRDRGSR
jgi:urease accessory protein